MAVFETWLNQDLQKPLKPQVLDGSLFTQDNAGNLVGVVLFNNGEPEEISGTVGGMILRADGTTVAVVDGNSNGNKGWIVLPQSAYAVPGQIVIVIKVTNGSTVMTIGAATVGVQKSSTDTIVDPGTIISGIDTLIATIDAAIDSIPADWSSLLTSIAPVFSTNTVYNVGDYVWHTTGADAPAKLYKFTSAHAVGAWDSTQVTAAVLSTDIKNLQHIYTPTTGKPTSNLALAFGGTVTLSQVKQDINGQVTVTDRTLTIPNTAATQSAAGLMSAADKQKLDAVESGKYGVCSTAAATQTKAVSISGITALTDGQTVTVRMTYEQEYNGQPKLNVSGTGAKNITRAGSAAAGKGEWQAGSVLCFVYNQTGDCWVIQNGNVATSSTYGKVLVDESANGQTDIVRALSSRVFFNTYVRDMITGAEVYDPENTYAVGAIVRNFGAMFRCTTPISTPEAWDVSHWERIAPMQEEIDGKADNVLANYTDSGLISAGNYSKLHGMPGYNLLTGYEGETASSVSSSGTFKGIPVDAAFSGLVGCPVVVSFDAIGNPGDTLRVYAYQSSGISIDTHQDNPATFTLTDAWTRFSFTAHVKLWPASLNDGTIGFFVSGGTVAFKLRRVKIEAGDTVTRWTPSAPDTATQVDLDEINTELHTTASQNLSTLRDTNTTSALTGMIRSKLNIVALTFNATISAVIQPGTWVHICDIPFRFYPQEQIFTMGYIFYAIQPEYDIVAIRISGASGEAGLYIKTLTKAMGASSTIYGSCAYIM